MECTAQTMERETVDELKQATRNVRSHHYGEGGAGSVVTDRLQRRTNDYLGLGDWWDLGILALVLWTASFGWYVWKIICDQGRKAYLEEVELLESDG